MANVKISEMIETTTASLTDIVNVVTTSGTPASWKSELGNLPYSATKAVFSSPDTTIVNVGSDISTFSMIANMNDSALDATLHFTLTPANITYDTNIPTLTGISKSAIFNGSSSKYTINGPLYTTGSINRPLTVDFWINFASITSYILPMFTHYNNATQGDMRIAIMSNQINVYRYTGSANNVMYARYDWIPTLGVWYHVAVVWQSNGHCFVAINGSGTDITPAGPDNGGGVGNTYAIGTVYDNDLSQSYWLNARVSNFCIRDNLAVWTSNFAAPIAIYNTTAPTEVSFTSFARTLVANESFADMRTDLGLGTAAIVDTGTGPNQIVKLNGSSQIPAVDGSLLTGIVMKPGLYRNKWFPASEFIPRITNGATYGEVEYASNYVQLPYFDFDAVTSQGIQIPVVMPDEWDRSTIKVKHYWTNGEASGGANDVVWRIRGKFLATSDAIDSAWGDPIGVTSTFTTDGDFVLSPVSAAITIGGTGSLAAGNLIILEVYRYMTGNTYTKKARYLGCFIQYNELTTSPAIWATP